MLPGLFVTGTDTGVGKTLVSCALLRLARARGLDAAGFKPVATGAVNGRWLDAEALREAGGAGEEIERLCPLRFQAPLAPWPAAQAEGRAVDLAKAQRALRERRARHAVVIAEGIGGVLVPLDEKTLVADFIAASRFPAVLVARAGLGTVNHTLLSLRELDRRGIPVAALLMNVTRLDDTENAAPSIAEIERHTAHRFLATLPYDAEGALAEAPSVRMVTRAAEYLSARLEIETLLERSPA